MAHIPISEEEERKHRFKRTVKIVVLVTLCVNSLAYAGMYFYKEAVIRAYDEGYTAGVGKGVDTAMANVAPICMRFWFKDSGSEARRALNDYCAKSSQLRKEGKIP